VEFAKSQTTRLCHWLKSKFTSPAAAGALEEAVKSPEKPLKWEALRLQVVQAIEEDVKFRAELEAMLPKPAEGQVAMAKGKKIKIAQVKGSRNRVEM